MVDLLVAKGLSVTSNEDPLGSSVGRVKGTRAKRVFDETNHLVVALGFGRKNDAYVSVGVVVPIAVARSCVS